MRDKTAGTQHTRATKPWLTPEFQLRRKPLIDFCTNEWQKTNERLSHPQNPSAEAYTAFSPPNTSIVLPVISKRWVRRCTYAATILVTCLWLMAKTSSVSSPDEPASIQGEILSPDLHRVDQAFGTNRRPYLSGVKQLSSLDTSRLGSARAGTSEAPGQRLIFIGDIHGCHEELMQLLAKVKYNRETDHIITTGDMINKGPQSGAVVDFLISQGASCVRGNHEDRILLKATEANSPSKPSSETFSERDDSEKRLAASLTPAQLEYLQSCPVILSLGQVPHHGSLVVVHAGLVPSVQLVDQDPWAVMNMRLVHHMTHVPSKEHNMAGYVSWAELWNQLQDRLTPETAVSQEDRKQLLDGFHRTTVVYGHDAQRGLRIRKHTKGLDSNCVRGHQLTAMVLSNQPREEIFQVDCGRYY